MSNNIWYARYVGDYQRKTSHLSLMENGAYSMLLDHYYSTAKPLPANAEQLHRICRALASDEQAAVLVVIKQFFRLEDDGYHNDKADEELIRRGKISEKRRNAASASHANAPANAPANAEHLHLQMHTQLQLQSQLHQQYSDPIGSDADASPRAGTDAGTVDLKTRIFGPLLAWMVKQSGKTEQQCRAMLGRWCSRHGEARTIEAVTAAARNAPLDPIPYVERIIRDGKQAKPSARESVSAHVHGLATALGVDGMATGKPTAGEPDRPRITAGHRHHDPAVRAGKDAGIRRGDDAPDRVRGSVRGAVWRPGGGSSDLPRDAGGFAGGPVGQGDSANQDAMDLGQSAAVPGGNPNNGGGRDGGTADVAWQGQNGDCQAGGPAERERHLGGTVGGTEVTDSAHCPEQTNGRGVGVAA